MPLLTKSKYIVGLSCPKYLWMMFHDLDKIPAFDPSTEYIMKQGNIVGKLAKQLFPDGIDLPEDDFKANIKKTQELIKQKKTIFEAGIISGNLYARADILEPVGNEWDIIEVKSSTQVKEDHIHDVSFQKHVYQLAGLKIRKCYLMHINNEFVKKGKIDPNKLLIKEEITAEVENVIVGISDRIDYMMEIVNSTEAPDVLIGKGCSNGLECISEDCWNFLPEGHVFELYYGGKKSLELLEAEIFSLKDIPDTFQLNSKQQLQRKCANTGETHVDKDGIKKFLATLKEPVQYLDFETFMTAVPLFDGTRPYQQIPFQFNFFVNGKGYDYLHDSKEDPRSRVLLELKKVIGPKGSVVVYNKSFEIGRLREMAEVVPSEKEWVENVISRIVDLIDPFKAFDYYNPKQKGSCSLKAVMPAVLGEDHYKKLNIGDGGLASTLYFEMMFDGGKDVRSDLLKYCQLDTEGMVWIVRELRGMVG
ncbi:MAG: DUF2779 domain-containing protein [archaeon]|nr:DUF2779 domain-containing protein [archaeon]